MSDHVNAAPEGVGLFLNPAGQRRIDFQQHSGEQFARLFVADGTEQASYLLAQERVDLLVIDLERFDRSIDLAALSALVAGRAGAPLLVICPFMSAGWLPDLMAAGPIDYAISPLHDAELNTLIAARLAAGRTAAPEAGQAGQTGQAGEVGQVGRAGRTGQVLQAGQTGQVVQAGQVGQAGQAGPVELRTLQTVHRRMQQALVECDDINKVAEQICEALCGLPGVVHASLFHLKEKGDLQLEAQMPEAGLNLARVLGRSDRLLQSPLRHAFPGMLAACSGELALLDAPEKAGEPELAVALRANEVAMVVGLPIPAAGVGKPRGAICLLYAQPQAFSADAMAALVDLAQLAGFGIRAAEMSREAEQQEARITHLATTDALTGVANRRRGEELLELEVKRARRYKAPLALILFDIDHFKAINDQFGHPVGDAALRTVAAATQHLLRASDVLVRSGGEEFQIVVAHTGAIDALKMAEKIRLAIEQTPIAGCDRLTVSLGVAQLGDQESADSLVLRVNAALARAKRAGRNRVELAMS